MEKILPSTSIDTLVQQHLISVRAYNSLASGGLYSVGDIMKYLQQGKHLLSLKNLGKKSELEIKKVLVECENQNQTSQPEGETIPSYQQLGGPVKEYISQAYYFTTSEIQKVNMYISEKYPDVADFYNVIVTKGKDEVLKIQPALTKEENIAYRRWHIDMLKGLVEFMDRHIQKQKEAKAAKEQLPYVPLFDDDPDRDYLSNKPQHDENLRRVFSSILDQTSKVYLDFSVTEIIQYFTTQETEMILQESYEALSNKWLSAWGKSFQKEYLPHYKDVIAYLDKPFAEFSKICPTKSKTKTVYEIYRLVQRFNSEAFSSYEHYTIDEELLRNKIKRDYPFLKDDQCDFVKSYYLENRVRPVFFLLFNHILTSSARECVYFRLHYGFTDGVERIYEEIASMFNLTSERIRQIVTDSDAILSNFHIRINEITHYRGVLDANLITECSPEFKDILNKENIPNNFAAFAAICTLFLDFEICDVLGYKVIMSPTLRQHINYKSLIEKFNKTYNKGCFKEVSYPFSYFTGNIPEVYNSGIKALLDFMAKDKQNITITDDEVILGQSRIEIETELYKILEQSGKPMYLQQLFDRFKSLYPSHRIKRPEQLKIYLYNNPHIRTIGKQSLYGLDFWEDVFFGNIKDLLREILEKSEGPIHINDLYALVKKSFPNTNLNSVKYTMAYDSLNRFIQFEDGYFGVASRTYPNSIKEARPISRFGFEQRMEMFKTFVDTHHRFPFFYGDDEEGALMRWLYNVTHDNIDVSPEQISKINAMIEGYAQLPYPQTLKEHTFLLNCQEYRQFTEQNNRLPSCNKESSLYQWFNRAKDNFPSYQDKRRDYFTELCAFLRSQGFNAPI